MAPTDTPDSYDERSILLQMLRYSQETAIGKVRGLSEDQARIAPLPTSPSMSPANVLNHLRWVEWSWINEDLFGGPEVSPMLADRPYSSFDEGSVLPLDEVLRLYEEQAAASLEVRVGALTPEEADVLGALAIADQVREDADRAALTVG